MFIFPFRAICLLCLIISSSFVLAQSNCDNRYRSRVFNSIQIYRDVVYSENAPKVIAASLGTETILNGDLKMDIFMPPPTDTVSKRPVVILAHGGGFVNVLFMGGTVLVGTKDNEDVQALADTLAHWGFVTASIEYRVGFDILSNTSIKRAVWRGAQDMSAAVRFFRKNAQWFDIDPGRVFIGGSSAGAFCAIHSTFVDGNERIPESYQITPILMQDLGELHSRPVVELTGFNPFSGSNVLGNDVDSIAQGVVAYWGAIADTDMFLGANSAPMKMFHGTNDIVVDSRCSKPFSSLILVAPVTCGSEVMDSVMTTLGLPHQTTIEQGEGHEYWGVLNGLWLPSGPNAFWSPMIQSTADYFYDIMRPATPTISGPAAAAPNTTYTFTIDQPNTNSTYCWEIDGGTIVSAVTDGPSIDVYFYTASTIGKVKVQEIDAAGVASLQREYPLNVSTSVGITSQQGTPIQLNIAPQPAEDYLQINLQNYTGNELVELILLDGLGRHCASASGTGSLFELETQALPAGLYVLEVRAGERRLRRKVLVR